MIVIDAFTFHHEFDLLKLRLDYLNDIVDYFVISEGKYTYSGKPKHYYLNQIFNQIPEKIQKKIISVHYEPDILNFNFPNKIRKLDYSNDCWKLEGQQRNSISKHLSCFNDNDLFMLSDVDEIPKKEVIELMSKKILLGVARCEMFYYNFTTFCGTNWAGTIFSTIKLARENKLDIMRKMRFSLPSIENGGWHFSYFGNPKDIINKLESFSHQEYNHPKIKNTENILNCIQNKINILDGRKFETYDISKFPINMQKLVIKFMKEKNEQS